MMMLARTGVLTALLACASSAAYASDFAVTKNTDSNDGLCAVDCSLREAIVAANALAGADRIILTAGATYILSIGPFDPAGLIVPGAGDLDITDTLTIEGNGSTVDANDIDRVFDIQGAFTVTVNNLTIRNGEAQGFLSLGGGIKIRGASVVLNNSIVTANSTLLESGERDGGGGIAVVGSFNPTTGLSSLASLTLNNTTVSSNTGSIGGGIVCVLCTLTTTNATITGNAATSGDGGGITVTGNASTAAMFGGAIIVNTVSGGSARGGALSIPAGTSTVTVTRARIVSNTGTTGSAVFNNAAIFNGVNTWWGCNFGPGAGGTGCAATANSVSGPAPGTTTSPFLILKASASPDSVPTGGSSTLTADLTFNSAAADTSGGGTISNGTIVGFAGTLGTFATPTSTTTGGKASNLYTAGGVPGSATLNATVDAQTVSTPFHFTDSPPAILTQPQSGAVTPGQKAMLTVVVGSISPATYQWYAGTSPNTGSPISEATSSTYTTPPLSSTSSVWVRVSNPYGAVDSTTATITVVPDLGLFRPSLGRWLTAGQADVDWGTAGDLPVPGDYDGDGIKDITVFQPATATWYIRGGATIVFGLPGDIPVPADYDGNGITDIAVFRPGTGMWHIRNGATVLWGLAGDLPVVADYNGDGSADIAVFRPSTGTWFIRNIATLVFGVAADIPAPADYDGDGTADVAVFQPATGTWFVKDQFTKEWGISSDVPVPLDRNGDGRAELGIFRRATGTWYFNDHTTDATQIVSFGAAGDIPLGRALPPVQTPWGDFDGDRKADLTVFRPSTSQWYSLRSLSGMADFSVHTFGSSTDTPVPRDFDGDGKLDIAVFQPSIGRWFVLQSSTNYVTFVSQDWGVSGDIPVLADYDGDGKADFAVFRPSTGSWYILLSSTGNTSYLQYDWGTTGDIPVPADYDGDGRADVAIFRPSAGQWYILNRLTGTYVARNHGLSGDVPIAADFDGDGKADIAVFRPSLGRWFVESSIDGSSTTVDWGLSSDTPMLADFDGDGKADIAVFRPSTGTWYVRGLFIGHWGMAGDVAVLKKP
jgi:CSLREA domain-containing protein